ncbi:RimJ/RimL family protein N-acetyltransferase [Jeotgalibacillus proteolyticus]|uniref:RimJ/RimL family protein N-acetyltransferase n=1 Tax=Jeotgalibacillus proteolyticus TaxID=2082395 RepID=A0A2S5GBQ9_9BACL|nr:GNAT family protein [Jeotgalibacillus proteolyticus]PPA70351.1 RimJ/RimL family protein N-acetyltransferase [Jeotgalibacillus proteolyticus]
MKDAEELLHFQTKNKDFFEQFSAGRPAEYYTLEYQQEKIKKWKHHMENDEEYQFGIYYESRLIGSISLFQVMRSYLQSAFIGYFLDKEFNGRGFTTQAVRLLVDHAFDHLHLHRIEAGVMPHNVGSIRVLEKSGFHKEGLAIKNVKINGKWEDHLVLAIINPMD